MKKKVLLIGVTVLYLALVFYTYNSWEEVRQGWGTVLLLCLATLNNLNNSYHIGNKVVALEKRIEELEVEQYKSI